MKPSPELLSKLVFWTAVVGFCVVVWIAIIAMIL